MMVAVLQRAADDRLLMGLLSMYRHRWLGLTHWIILQNALCCWCLGYLQYSSSRRSEMAMQYFICWLMIHILIKLIVVRLVVLLDIFSLYIPGSIAQHENNLLIKVVSRLQLLLTNLRLLFMWIIIITWCPLTKTLKRTSLVCTFDRGTEGSADSFRCTNNSITLMYCIDGKSMIEDAFILISILFNNNS